MHSNKAGVRIIAGEYRGRRIAVPDRPGLRPTPDRVRETLFNWLGQSLDGLACLDLFAGSGALGFEAARAAPRASSWSSTTAPCSRALRKTRELLAARQVQLVLDDAFAYLKRATNASTWFSSIPRSGRMRCRRYSSLEASFRHARLRGVRRTGRSRRSVARAQARARAGQVSYQLLEWRGDDQGDLPGNV